MQPLWVLLGNIDVAECRNLLPYHPNVSRPTTGTAGTKAHDTETSDQSAETVAHV